MNSNILQVRPWNVSATKLLLTVLVTAALCLSACSAWSQTTSTVTVNASSISATVAPEGYGLNTYVFDAFMTSSGVAGAVSSSGVKALRYPGGSDSDTFYFVSGTDQYMPCTGYMDATDTFNNFMSDLAIPAGAKPVITVNYGSNGSCNGGGSPSTAASWVQYANVTNNYGIVYWEIGNETYGNGFHSGWDWEYDLHDTDQTAADRVGNSALSPTTYGTNAGAYVKAMKAVDPNIKICISVNDSWTPTFSQGAFQGISSALSGTGLFPDCVIVHWYPSGTVAQNLAAQAGIPAEVATIRSDLNNYYTLSNKNAIQIIVTETGPSSSINQGNEAFLFVADDYLTWFENGASNVDYQDLHQGFLEASSSDWTTPQAPWYSVSLSSTVARVGDNMVAATSSNALLRAHAVNRTDGKVGVVLINEDPSNNTTVNVSVSGATLSTSGTQYNFGNANFSGGNWTANSGISSSTINGVGDNFTVTVPAYSATAVVIPVSGSSTLIANGTYVITGVGSGSAIDDPGSSKTGGTDMQIYTVNDGTNQQWTLTNLGNNVIYLVNVASGLALDVSGDSKTSGALVDQWAYGGTTNQQWNVIAVSGGFELTSVNSGLALSTVGGGTANGTKLDQLTYGGGSSQQWKFVAP